MKTQLLTLAILLQSLPVMAASSWNCNAYRDQSGSILMGTHRITFAADGSSASYSQGESIGPGAQLSTTSLTNPNVSEPNSTHVQLKSDEIDLSIDTSQSQPYCGNIGTLSLFSLSGSTSQSSSSGNFLNVTWCCRETE